MAKKSKGARKTAKVFHEWGLGSLHSGSKHGPIVNYSGKRNPQAIAIALSEGRKASRGRRGRRR